MTNEHSGISRRKLLRTTAIAVPTASVLAFGSTLVTAPAANALKQDGWWGPETSAGLQRFMNRLFPEANLTVDGVITSQPDYYASNCPGITGGWEWVPSDAKGSPTIYYVHKWLGWRNPSRYFRDATIEKLQSHYGISPDRRLDGPSQTIQALQNEINQYV